MRPLDHLVGLYPADRLAWRTLAEALTPPPDQPVSQWAEEHVVFPDGPHARQKWRTSPLIRRPLDCLGLNHPSTLVGLMAGAQSLKTSAYCVGFLHRVCTEPSQEILALQTDTDRTNFEENKLWPFIRACEEARRRVMPKRTKTTSGSKDGYVRFQGGFLVVTQAQSGSGLQGHTTRVAAGDEMSSWPRAVKGQGKTVDNLWMRTLAFTLVGRKRIAMSTPGDEGDCLITEIYEAGTAELLYVPCPHCGAFQALEIEAFTVFEGRAVFLCLGCGRPIEHTHKEEMVARGVWVPCFTSVDPEAAERREQAEAEAEHGVVVEDLEENPANPRPPPVIAPGELGRWAHPEEVAHHGLDGPGRDVEGREPTFRWWQALSPLVDWEEIRAWRNKAKHDPDAQKNFQQKCLARAYAEVIDAPPIDDLVDCAQRLGRPEWVIPEDCIIVTAAIDVQHNRLEVDWYAHGPFGRAAWLGTQIVNGSPEDPTTWRKAWRLVDSVTVKGPHTCELRADLVLVDSGYATAHVYQAVRGRPNALAIKGIEDPEAVPIGRPKDVKGIVRNREIKAKLYPVGVYGLKTSVLRGLTQWRLEMDPEGAGGRLTGAISLHAKTTKADAEQLTAEYLSTEKRDRRGRRTFQKRRQNAPNERFDLAVYNLAAAASFGCRLFSEDTWRAYFRERAADGPTAQRYELPLAELWSRQGDALAAPRSDEAGGAARVEPGPVEAGAPAASPAEGAPASTDRPDPAGVGPAVPAEGAASGESARGTDADPRRDRGENRPGSQSGPAAASSDPAAPPRNPGLTPKMPAALMRLAALCKER